MCLTGFELVVRAAMCTGELIVELLAGVQMVTEGFLLLGVHGAAETGKHSPMKIKTHSHVRPSWRPNVTTERKADKEVALIRGGTPEYRGLLDYKQ